MAIVSNTLIGKSSGSVGGTTFSSWKGKNVLKAKPVSVANPKTNKQMAQRASLAAAVAFYRQASTVLNLGFKGLASGKSAYNAFASQAVKNAWSYNDSATPAYDPSELKISSGSIAQTKLTSKEIEIPAKAVVVSYPKTVQGAGQSLTDRLLIVVQNQTKGIVEGFVTNKTRNDETATVNFSGEVAEGDTINIWAGFVSADGLRASDSYFGSVVADDGL